MSVTKDLLDKIQDYHRIAYDILIKIGVIEECDCKSGYYYETYKLDKDTIYAISSNKLKEKYGEKQDYKIFYSQIAEILSSASTCSTCSHCIEECCHEK